MLQNFDCCALRKESVKLNELKKKIIDKSQWFNQLSKRAQFSLKYLETMAKLSPQVYFQKQLNIS